MFEVFFDRIDPALRPPAEQIHFPSTENIEGYGEQIAQLGGADTCYGGIGWCGHIAFWESDLGHEFAGDLDAYKRGRTSHRRADADDHHAERAALLRRRLVGGAAQGRHHRSGGDPRARSGAASGSTATSVVASPGSASSPASWRTAR